MTECAASDAACLPIRLLAEMLQLSLHIHSLISTLVVLVLIMIMITRKAVTESMRVWGCACRCRQLRCVVIPAALLLGCSLQQGLLQCVLWAHLAGRLLALPPLSICTVIIHTGSVRICPDQHLGCLGLGFAVRC